VSEVTLELRVYNGIKLLQERKCVATPEALTIIEAVLDGAKIIPFEYSRYRGWKVYFENSPCPDCEGSGKVWLYPGAYKYKGLGTKKCPTCNGTGEV